MGRGMPHDDLPSRHLPALPYGKICIRLEDNGTWAWDKKRDQAWEQG